MQSQSSNGTRQTAVSKSAKSVANKTAMDSVEEGLEDFSKGKI